MDAQGERRSTRSQDDLAPRLVAARGKLSRDERELPRNKSADQKAASRKLESALRQLEQKLTERRPRPDLLIAQHRRARAGGKASDARLAWRWFESRSLRPHEAQGRTFGSTGPGPKRNRRDNMEDRLAALEKEDPHEQLLAELKEARA